MVLDSVPGRRALPADRRRHEGGGDLHGRLRAALSGRAGAALIGRPLLDGGLRLLDFTANRGELTEAEADKIPPLLALSSGRLARGLLRVQAASADNSDATVDAISTPVLTDGTVAGSLTFFSEV